jgi:hypothetical protein
MRSVLRNTDFLLNHALSELDMLTYFISHTVIAARSPLYHGTDSLISISDNDAEATDELRWQSDTTKVIQQPRPNISIPIILAGSYFDEVKAYDLFSFLEFAEEIGGLLKP